MKAGDESPRADLPPMPPGAGGVSVESLAPAPGSQGAPLPSPRVDMLPSREGPRSQLVANAVALELDLGAWVDSEGAGTTVYYVYEKATLRYSALTGKVVGAEVYDQRTGKPFLIDRPVLDAALSQHLGALRSAEVARGWSRFGFERASVVWNRATGEVELEWPAACPIALS